MTFSLMLNSKMKGKFKYIINSSALLAGFAIFLLIYLVYNHLPMFPSLYLDTQREKEIVEFSDRLLNNFKSDILIFRYWPLDRYSAHVEQLDLIKKANEFSEKNDFVQVRISKEENLVVYSHTIFSMWRYDYFYERKTKKDGTSEYQITTYCSKRR